MLRMSQRRPGGCLEDQPCRLSANKARHATVSTASREAKSRFDTKARRLKYETGIVFSLPDARSRERQENH